MALTLQEEPDTLVLIKSLYPQLTGKEQRVADYILNHNDVIYRTVTEVVRESGASYGSVDRFCKKIGCSGFQDLKIQLAEAFATLRAQEKEAESENYILATAKQSIREIQNTVQFLSKDKIDGVAQAIISSHFVLIAAISSSAGNALGIDYRFARFGIRSLAVIDNHMQRHRAATLTKNDVAFLISYSGSTKEIIATGEIAKKSGALVISLTNHLESPISELSDIKLNTGIESDPLGSEIASKVAVDFVVSVLFERIGQLLKKSRSILAKTFEATSDRQL